MQEKIPTICCIYMIYLKLSSQRRQGILRKLMNPFLRCTITLAYTQNLNSLHYYLQFWLVLTAPMYRYTSAVMIYVCSFMRKSSSLKIHISIFMGMCDHAPSFKLEYSTLMCLVFTVQLGKIGQLSCLHSVPQLSKFINKQLT